MTDSRAIARIKNEAAALDRLAASPDPRRIPMSTFPTAKSQEFADALQRMRDDYAELRTSISDVRDEWKTLEDEDRNAAVAIITALGTAISNASEELESIYMDAIDDEPERDEASDCELVAWLNSATEPEFHSTTTP